MYCPLGIGGFITFNMMPNNFLLSYCSLTPVIKNHESRFQAPKVSPFSRPQCSLACLPCYARHFLYPPVSYAPKHQSQEQMLASFVIGEESMLPCLLAAQQRQCNDLANGRQKTTEVCRTRFVATSFRGGWAVVERGFMTIYDKEITVCSLSLNVKNPHT